MLVPRKAFLTSGRGHHAEPLVAFELALREAGIAAQNLVTVSSILPPGCPIIPRDEGEPYLQAGQILHVVMARAESSTPGETVGAGVGIAIPKDRTVHGFIAEAHSHHQPQGELESHAEDLATTMLASTLGLNVPDGLDAAARARVLREAEEIGRSGAVASVVEVGDDGKSACAVAVCVFVMEWMMGESA